jgi:hypothetical protein
MTRRLVLALLLLTTLALAVTGAAAQTAVTDQRLPVIYRLLEKASTYQYGCFAPCLCPILTEMPVRGTFVLIPAGSDGLFTSFRVAEVNWTVAFGQPELRVTGSGTYKIGGEFALQQQLTLALKIGDQAEQKFDSGLVPAGDVRFPAISVPVSLNGGVCFDTVITISALPVPLEEIRPYRLTGGTTFQRGCFDPCDCALGQELPVTGSLALVPLRRNLFVTEFAVVNVRWQVGAIDGTALRTIPIRGFGTYWTGGDFALQQQLSLDLLVDGEPQTHYDSGPVLGSSYPRLNVPISINGGVCFDTVINVQARPRRIGASRPSSGGYSLK